MSPASLRLLGVLAVTALGSVSAAPQLGFLKPAADLPCCVD